MNYEYLKPEEKERREYEELKNFEEKLEFFLRLTAFVIGISLGALASYYLVN